MSLCETIKTGHVPIKAWVQGVPVEQEAFKQLRNVAELPFVFHHVAAMPDVHWGLGATVGSVIPCQGAIIPAAVGVDIGCGMMAVRTNLDEGRLPKDLALLRQALERAIPHGRTHNGGPGDRGAWGQLPPPVLAAWNRKGDRGLPLGERLDRLTRSHPAIAKANSIHHLGTLGTGNHFIELCVEQGDRHLWLMLHSGSRGVGNKIGTHFIERAKQEMKRRGINLPDPDLAFLEERSTLFNDYVEAAHWAQEFAVLNRELMMASALEVLGSFFGEVRRDGVEVNCHHNYVAREEHFGKTIWLTRKGAVRARSGELGIIPGSMGAKSYIVQGKGNPDSFHSCAHGAGRAMSRNDARRRFTVADHLLATAGVECRKDAQVLDETPAAYKPIDLVMAAQEDLVSVLYTLKQVVCVKG